MKIALTVNGRLVATDVAPRTNLADLLREQLLLTGTHVGCEHGICGACTVEIDGEIARSCITYAVTCDGASVRTIEGFDDDAIMVPLRKAFTEEHALQCGYCTPGMLIAARDLVRRKGQLARADIRVEMSGNLCRCTGYMGIVSAIARVMAEQPTLAEAHQSATNGWLGPAPGPQAKITAQPDQRAMQDDIVERSVVASPALRAPRRPVRVTVGNIEDVDGVMRLTQSFVLEHARDVVWQLMSDPQAVAHCMPGAQLDGPPRDGNISGRIEVKLGPIMARFAGEGTVEQFPTEYRQVIRGHGGDRKSGSRVTGSVDYRLSAIAEAEATRVEVVISYALTGLLAQLGRSGLARDLARRIGETFAQNIDAQLSDPSDTSVSKVQISGVSLVLQVIAGHLRAFLSRYFRW